MIFSVQSLKYSFAFLCAVCAALLGACGSVVVKDASSTFVNANQTLASALSKSSTDYTDALDEKKRLTIISDASCPIRENRIFIRSNPILIDSKTSPPKFSPYLSLDSRLIADSDCQKLQACEQTSTSSPKSCKSSCYGDAEGACLIKLEVLLNAKSSEDKSVTAAAPQNADYLAKVSAFSNALYQVEYKSRGSRAPSPSSQFVTGNMRVLTEYVDLLATLADKQTSDAQIQSEALAKRITTLVGGYSALTKTQLTAAGKKTQDAIVKDLPLFGALIADLTDISKNASDVAKIKMIVTRSAPNVEELLTSIEPVAETEALLGGLIARENAWDMRTKLAEEFSASTSEQQRSALFVDVGKISLDQDGKTRAKIVEAVEAVKTAHSTLVRIIVNPNLDDSAKIRAAQWIEFRTIAVDAADLVNQLR